MTSPASTRMTSPAGPPPAIFRRWIHSREEDAGGIEVYRPEGFPFPPSFGRDGFEPLANGTFLQHDIGPNDALVTTKGRWQLLPRRRLAVTFPPGERPGFTFGIAALDETVLRIRRATRQQNGGLPVAAEAQLEAHRALPPPASFRLIAYDRAEVLTVENKPHRYVLQVSGIKPFAKMVVKLMPLVYVRQPEYWEIEVVGGVQGAAIAAKLPYTVTLPLGGTLGSRGIQVLGANRSDIFDVPPGQEPNDR